MSPSLLKKTLEVKDLFVRIQTPDHIIRAVNGVSFNLPAGKTLSIVGESGSGKSMLCKSVLRLLPKNAKVTSKSIIHLNGYGNIEQLPEKEFNRIRGREMAMIFQDPMSCLNPVMKVGKQLAEPRFQHTGTNAGQVQGKVVSLMKSVGISRPEQRFHQYPHQLSGGICQRVAIAIALACKPKLLVADEPTTALDVTVQAEILDLLSLTQSQEKMSMILLTHDLGVAFSRADEIAVMYAGKIVEQAQADVMFHHIKMPYTKALMDSIPNLDDRPHTFLSSIKGLPPDLTQKMSGCSFAPRCSRARKPCMKKEPVLRHYGDKRHLVACWYPLKETAR